MESRSFIKQWAAHVAVSDTKVPLRTCKQLQETTKTMYWLTELKLQEYLLQS